MLLFVSAIERHWVDRMKETGVPMSWTLEYDLRASKGSIERVDGVLFLASEKHEPVVWYDVGMHRNCPPDGREKQEFISPLIQVTCTTAQYTHLQYPLLRSFWWCSMPITRGSRGCSLRSTLASYITVLEYRYRHIKGVQIKLRQSFHSTTHSRQEVIDHSLVIAWRS